MQLDLISLAAPFSLPLYQQLVRGALESSELYDVYRWTTRPRVALHPYDDGGRPLPPEVLATIRAAVPRAIAAWSAGLFEGVTVEDIETPDWQEGWIVLHVLRSESSPHCGLESFRHRDGRIVTSRIELALENCGCGSRKISTNTVSHELAHALGFWHARGPYVLAPETSDTCDSFENEIITPVEAAHARIAYSRPPGNKDPDRDPEAFSSVKAVGLRQSRTLVCGRARR